VSYHAIFDREFHPTLSFLLGPSNNSHCMPRVPQTQVAACACVAPTE
jgi:hypothetical protein